jgi:hypothetical protein
VANGSRGKRHSEIVIAATSATFLPYDICTQVSFQNKTVEAPACFFRNDRHAGKTSGCRNYSSPDSRYSLAIKFGDSCLDHCLVVRFLIPKCRANNTTFLPFAQTEREQRSWSLITWVIVWTLRHWSLVIPGSLGLWLRHNAWSLVNSACPNPLISPLCTGLHINKKYFLHPLGGKNHFACHRQRTSKKTSLLSCYSRPFASFAVRFHTIITQSSHINVTAKNSGTPACSTFSAPYLQKTSSKKTSNSHINPYERSSSSRDPSLHKFLLLNPPNEANLRPVKFGPQPVRRRRASRPAPGAWGVIPLDGEPIRRKARKEYEKILRDLDLAKADADRFENEDKPQFAKWVNSNFGALLTEIRGLQEKLFHAQSLVEEVQQEFFLGNYRSINKAYKNVVHRREHPEIQEEEARKPDEEEDAFRKDFEEVFGKSEDEFWQKINGESEPFVPPSRKAEVKQGSRLKDLYRRLVRLLHPDKGAKGGKKEIEWWHQTQDAYQTGNVEQLELILTLVEMEDRGSKHATVSVLSQLTIEFKKSLKALKRKIAGLKKDLAWNFSQLTDFSALLVRVRNELQSDRDRILWLLQKYEQQIRSWETTPAPARKRVRARRGSWQDEEWF